MPFLVYAIALLIAAGTLALGVNLATAPDHGPQQGTVNTALRQIPLGKPSDVSRGDPNNQLTPVYPAAPGKDLAPVETADTKAANAETAKLATSGATQQVAATAGLASKEKDAATDHATPDSRAHDRKAQDDKPQDVKRRAIRRTVQSPASRGEALRADGSRIASRKRASELDEVERVVRRLPAERSNRVVVIERSAFGFGRRPVVIYDEQ